MANDGDPGVLPRRADTTADAAAPKASAVVPAFPGPARTELDFFVSYTAADAHWAEWIAWELEAAGYRTKLQKWDILPGTNFALEMQHAAEQAARTVAVLSPAYFASQYGAAEWAAAFVADPSGADRKLIPVRVTDCAPPGLLRPIVYVDLFGQGEADARHRLRAGVQLGRAKPSSAPAFPGSVAAAAASPSRPQPVFPGDLPAVWNVPFQSSRFFAGRAALLAQLHDELDKNPAKRAVLWGLGGIGKTQLAVEYAYAHKLVTFDAVLWVSADSPEALHANLAALSDDHALQLPESRGREQAERLNAVLRWLKEHPRWLLVIDNADTEAAADAVIALAQRLPPRHVIVTSRRSSWPSDFCALEVDTLPPQVAAQFLLQRTAQTNKPALGSEAEALAVAQELDGLPLALEQAAAFMLQRRMRFSNYSAKLSEALRFVMKGGPADQKSVFTTWLVTEEALAPEARAVLRLACWLSPDPIRRDFFAADGGEAFRQALRWCGGELTADDVGEALERGVLQLADYSLVECAATEFALHRVLARVLRERIAEVEREPWVGLVLTVMAKVTACDPYDVRSVPVLGPLQQHLAELVGHADGLGIAAPTSLLMARLAGFFMEQARFGEAEPLKRRALAIDESNFGPEHPKVALRLNNLAQLLQDTNRLAEAEPLMRRALAIDESSYGPEHPDVARDLNNLAALLQSTNRLREAEPLVRRALAIDESSYGPEHPNAAIRLNNLAQLLQSTNRLGEAEPLMRRTLAINDSSYGPEHPRVATCLNNLAHLLAATNRLGEAEPLMRRALAIDESAYGSEHPDVATRLHNLAQLLHLTNRLGEAEPLMRRALAIDERSYGPEHPAVAIRLNNLGQLLKATNRLGEAEPVMRRALAIDERSYGPEHPSVARDLNNLAQLLKATDRLGEAEPLMRRALAIDESSYGPEHPFVAGDLNNLAQLLKATDRLAEAEPLMRRALAIDESSCDPEHPSVARDLNNLALLLQATNRLGEAEPLMRRALAIVAASLGDDHPSTEIARNNLKLLLAASDDR